MRPAASKKQWGDGRVGALVRGCVIQLLVWLFSFNSLCRPPPYIGGAQLWVTPCLAGWGSF